MGGLKNLFNRLFHKKREQLKEFARFGGHTFYILDAVPDHCVNRFFHFLSRNEQISTLGIPLKYITSIADQLDAIANSPKLNLNLPILANQLRFACQVEDTKWYHLTIAVIEAFVLIDDEPLLEMSEKHNKIKRELLLKDPEVRLFFSNIAIEYLMKLDNTFKDFNLEAYLTKNAVILNELESITT
jgi:hypothetical protein